MKTQNFFHKKKHVDIGNLKNLKIYKFKEVIFRNYHCYILCYHHDKHLFILDRVLGIDK